MLLVCSLFVMSVLLVLVCVEVEIHQISFHRHHWHLSPLECFSIQRFTTRPSPNDRDGAGRQHLCLGYYRIHCLLWCQITVLGCVVWCVCVGVWSPGELMQTAAKLNTEVSNVEAQKNQKDKSAAILFIYLFIFPPKIWQNCHCCFRGPHWKWMENFVFSLRCRIKPMFF